MREVVMVQLRNVLTAAGLFLVLLLLSSCYTYGTEPEFVRGKISQQSESMRYAKVIPAEAFMAQYEQFRGDAAAGQRSYRVAVGTRLQVEVVNQGISRAVYVGPDGQVDLPLVGTVQAGGKLLDDLRSEHKERYAPFFKNDFQINVNTERPEYFYGPRGINLAGRATVVIASRSLRGATVELYGDEGLIEVLFAHYGGSRDLGDKPEWKEVGIIREVVLEEDKAPETIVILCDLESLLFYGDTRQNVPIRHRDIVFVPRRRDTLIEELHDSLGYWSSMLSDVQQIRDIVKAMEGW
jgi:protein involved in polysaccharide export with SLBB domain